MQSDNRTRSAGAARCATFLVALLCASNDEVLAGGWDRFDQGIDLLFDPGKVTFDVGLYEAIPHRKFNSVNGISETVNEAPNFFRPSVNAKFAPFENAACLAAYRQPFGLAIDYGSTWSQAKAVVSQTLTVDELGLTCSYRVPAGPGYVRLIGGLTRDFATFHQDALNALPNGTFIRPTLDADAATTGWRAGLAYEMPNKAFRASLVYYSGLDFFGQGSVKQLRLGGNAFLNIVPVTASPSLPRAVEGVVQAGIAPNWLNTVSIKWVDWSVVTSIPIIVSMDTGPLRAGRTLSTLNVFFRDGWTISDTITHRWNDKLSLSVRVGWDRGVSTGWTDNSDAWQTIFFANYKISDHLEVTAGAGVAFLAGGEINKLAQGGMFNATFGPGNIVFTNLGFRYRL
jgi:long-chain fatty acid transport protein